MEFIEFPKIYRLSREVIVTEKIDGTNGCIGINDAGEVFAGSRSRWVTEADDNHGFAKWVSGNKQELLKLGPGRHFGEWWGQGIQRGYGMKEKVFSLFNTSRWSDDTLRPECCRVVPTILRSDPEMSFGIASLAMSTLRLQGSFAAPGFMRPEGIVLFHAQGNIFLKKTFDKDQEWKGKQV